MGIMLTLNTTFYHFAEWLDDQLWQMLFSPSRTEDGTEYYITYDWKADLGLCLDQVGRIRKKRLELFRQFSDGYLGVWIEHNPGEGLQRETVMATMSFEIVTPRPRHLQVIIDERFAELPAIVPPAIKDRLSELLRRIVLVWPEAQPQFREALPELQPFVSSQEWERWQQILSRVDEPPALPADTPTQEIMTQPSPDAPLSAWIEFFNPTGRPGRPTPYEDIRAIVEVHIRHRNRDAVFREWSANEAVTSRQLADPYDSFKKMLERGGKKLGQNE